MEPRQKMALPRYAPLLQLYELTSTLRQTVHRKGKLANNLVFMSKIWYKLFNHFHFTFRTGVVFISSFSH